MLMKRILTKKYDADDGYDDDSDDNVNDDDYDGDDFDELQKNHYLLMMIILIVYTHCRMIKFIIASILSIFFC